MNEVIQILKIAKTLVARSPLQDAIKTLKRLDELADNIDDSIETFSLHFRVAGEISTEVNTQLMLLKKSRSGLEKAKQTKHFVEGIVKNFPVDKTALRVLKDCDVMIARFTRQAIQSKKIVSTLSKKALPPALKKYAQTVARIIRSKLVDPKRLEAVPWQSEHYRGGVDYQVVINVDVSGSGLHFHRNKATLTIVENTNTREPPSVEGQQGNLSAKEAAYEIINALTGWSGLKGEDAKIAQRAEAAKFVAAQLNRVIGMGRYWQTEEAKISQGNTEIEAAYRSSLPKDGEREVGEGQYRYMVEDEIERFKKIFEPNLSSVKNAIKSIRYGDGEKSWISIFVTLK